MNMDATLNEQTSTQSAPVTDGATQGVVGVSGRVTVIIPLFNRVQYIEETIRSVLIQDHADVELIVVDDGSSDGGYERVKQLSEEKGFRLLTHPERANRGQSAAINLGLDHATGEFIAILDSDDLFLPGKLKRQVDYLKHHPEIGLVYGNGYAIDAEGNQLYPIHEDNHVEPNDANAVLLDCYMLLPQNSLVRHSVYQEVGRFEEGFRAAQDHDMLIRIAEVAQFAYQPEPVFCYRRHDDSISSQGQETRWRNGFKILQRARARYPYQRKTLRKRAAVLNFRLGQALLGKRQFAAALWYLLRAGLLDPQRAIAVLTGREVVR